MCHTLLAGLGTIGSQIGMNLLLENPHISLIAIDRDKVEKRNLGVQIYDASMVSFFKTDAFLSAIYSVIGDVPPNLKTLQMNITSKSTEFIVPAGTLTDEDVETLKKEGVKTGRIIKYKDSEQILTIDAFDNYESRDLLVGKSSNVVHLGFSPDLVATVLWDDAYKSHKSEEAGDVCEWQEYRWWLHGVTSLMTMNILQFLADGSKKNMIIEKNLTFSNF